MTTIQYRPQTTEEAASVENRRNVLEAKLSIWSKRLEYAKGARKAECQTAVDDLTARLAAL